MSTTDRPAPAIATASDSPGASGTLKLRALSARVSTASNHTGGSVEHLREIVRRTGGMSAKMYRPLRDGKEPNLGEGLEGFERARQRGWLNVLLETMEPRGRRSVGQLAEQPVQNRLLVLQKAVVAVHEQGGGA